MSRPAVSQSITVAAPPGVVWQALTDVALRARWVHGVDRAHWCDAAEPAPGARFHEHGHDDSGAWLRTREIESLEPGRELIYVDSWRDVEHHRIGIWSAPEMGMLTRIAVEAEPAGTRVDVEVQLPELTLMEALIDSVTGHRWEERLAGAGEQIAAALAADLQRLEVILTAPVSTA